MRSRSHRVNWPALFCSVGVFVCIALAILNAVLYANHPHGRGLSLFAAVWCAAMGAITLRNTKKL